MGSNTAVGESLPNGQMDHVLMIDELLESEGRVARLVIGSGTGQVAPADLLGINLEMASMVSEGLLSDRLTNAKFCGPVNMQTGLAPGWQPIGNNMGIVRNELVRGMFLSGDESQLVHSYAEPGGGLMQTGRYLGEDEEFEVEIWAKVRHEPVTVEISLRPLPSRATEYSKASVVIDASYWKCYKVRLRSTCEDAEAAFMVMLMTPGVVLFDQIHLRPVDEPLLSKETMAHVRALQMPTLRFPGGCMSTNYHWRLGTGPVHLRPSLPDPVFKERADYDFGTDEYLALCQEQGIRPYITVNIGSGTAEEAGAWARYCAEWFESRGLDLPEIYFQMGNEQYGSWESSHMNAPMFLEALRDFVPAVRAGYPRALIVGLGEALCGSVAGAAPTPLRELILSEGRDLVDIIAINRYKGQWYADSREQVFNAIESVDKIKNDLVELIADCQRHGFAPRLALPEWNYWLFASHWDGKKFFEPDDVQHGLFVSGMFHMMARLAPYLELAAYEQLVNAMGLVNNHGGQVTVSAISELFQLYRPAFPGEVVDVDISTSELAGGIAQVDALALRQDDVVWVFASNRSLDESVTLAVDGVFGARSEARLFVADDYQSPMTERSASSRGDGWELPPLSLLRVCYQE